MATTELLRDQVSVPSTVELVDMIDTCGSTLLDTFNNLLDHARINHSFVPTDRKSDEDFSEGLQAGISSNEHDAIDLGILVEEVVAIVTLGHSAMTTMQKGLVRKSSTSSADGNLHGHEESFQGLSTLVTVNIQAGIDWSLELESGSWKRIVMNLCGNALKYTESGSIDVSLSMVCSVPDAGESPKRIRLRVRDSGIGISATYLRYHLFTSFAQENSMMPGTGLGLALCQQLVEAMEGTIDVTSEKGLGTMVDILVPVASPNANLPPSGAPSDESARHTLGGLKLCYISSALSDIESTESRESKSKLYEALQNIITTIATDDGMEVSVVTAGQSYPAADLYFFDNAAGVPPKTSAGRVARDKVFALAPLVFLQSVPSSRSSPQANQRKKATALSHPVGPIKLRRVFVDALSKARQLDPSKFNSDVNMPVDDTQITKPELVAAAGIVPQQTMEPSTANIDSSQVEPANGTDSLHVLVVDDNNINLKLLVALMDKLHYTFEAATDGLQAVQRYEESISGGRKTFDAVVMDVSMPILDGFDATRRIRSIEAEAECSRCLIIALTGLGSEAAQVEASTAGFDMYMKKPVRLKQISAVLHKSGKRNA